MAESFRVNINPELIEWAVDTSGYLTEDIAKSVGVKPEVLLSWIDGSAMPTWNQLKALANKTKRPVAAFYLLSPPVEPKKPRDFRTFYGGVRSDFSPKLIQLIREARSLRGQAEELLDTSNEPPVFPELPLFRIKDDPDECAHRLRTFLDITVEEQMSWKDAYAALSAWRDVFFSKGVIVVQLSIDPEEARGLSENDDRLSLIVVSSKESPYPRIFTMFHELCHLCLRLAGVSGPRLDIEPRGHLSFVERFCDSVAGAFLVPLDDPIVHQLVSNIVSDGAVDRDALRSASNRLKVSQSAILYRAFDAGFISQLTYSAIMDEWKASSTTRLTGPVRLERRRVASLGRNYTSLVFDALDQGRLSTHEACNFLGISPKWLEHVRTEAHSGATNA